MFKSHKEATFSVVPAECCEEELFKKARQWGWTMTNKARGFSEAHRIFSAADERIHAHPWAVTDSSNWIHFILPDASIVSSEKEPEFGGVQWKMQRHFKKPQSACYWRGLLKTVMVEMTTVNISTKEIQWHFDINIQGNERLIIVRYFRGWVVLSSVHFIWRLFWLVSGLGNAFKLFKLKVKTGDVLYFCYCRQIP